MLKKHRATLKPSAYRDHIAALILPSLKFRSDKITILNFCISEVGVLSTIKHLIKLVLRKFSNYLNR
jgi:hypothetical protein